MKLKSMIVLSVLVASTLLTGCAAQLQATRAMESAAAVSLRAAEDNHLSVLTFDLCATPYSAIVRHPELVPGISALCLPGGNLTNPANLLNGVLTHQLTQPAAQSVQSQADTVPK